MQMSIREWAGSNTEAFAALERAVAVVLAERAVPPEVRNDVSQEFWISAFSSLQSGAR